MKNKIKAIVFDVGGVLALGKNSYLVGKDFKPSGVHVRVAKKLKLQMDQYLDSIELNYSLAIEGKISEKKVLEIFAKNMRTTPTKLKKLYIKSYQKNFKQNRFLFRRVKKLKKKGYILGVLSDQWPVSKQALMPEKYYKDFDTILVSCDLGMRKPKPAIYDLMVKKLKLKPSEILFIDNQEWNLSVPKNMGIKTILFEDNKQFLKDLNKFL